MKLSFPFSPSRRYLTGIDWTIGTLDHVMRQQTGVGNLSQVILDMDGLLPPEKLQAALAMISARLPIIHGRVARDWLNLAPYWKFGDGPDRAVIPLRTVTVAADAENAAWHALARHVNTPLRGPREHLRFLLVHLGPQRSRLGMVFDHRLLDAFGAEAFLRLIEETSIGRLDQVLSRVRQVEPPHLDDWGNQFRSGRTINGFRLQLSQGDVTALPMPPARRGRAARFLHEGLSAAEASRFAELAARESGVPLLLPSAVARGVAAMHPALAASSLRGQQYVVAVSVDARPPEQVWENLLFNHLSFLAFRASPASAGDVAAAALAMRDQLFEQMKQGIPVALQHATMLTRICPHAIGGRLSRIPFEGRGCSFYFACLRKSALEASSFLGLPVRNLLHTPRVPPPPGVGICLTFFGDRLNLVLSYLDGVLDDAAARQVMQRLKSLMVEA